MGETGPNSLVIAPVDSTDLAAWKTGFATADAATRA
jgi:hypothetical protein